MLHCTCNTQSVHVQYMYTSDMNQMDTKYMFGIDKSTGTKCTCSCTSISTLYTVHFRTICLYVYDVHVLV